MDKKKAKNLIISFDKFEVLNFKKNIPQTEPKDFGFSVYIHRDIDIEKMSLEIIIKVQAKKSQKSKKPYLDITTKTLFDIESQNGLEKEKFPIDILLDLISSAYATTRGFILAKNESNFIGESPLPLLDINEIRKQEKNK